MKVTPIEKPRESVISDPVRIARWELMTVANFIQSRAYDVDCDWQDVRDAAIHRLRKVGSRTAAGPS